MRQNDRRISIKASFYILIAAILVFALNSLVITKKADGEAIRLVPSISATKTAALDPTNSPTAGDLNGNGLVNPGDRLTYTITIPNAGPDAATNVTLNDPIDANTTLLSDSVIASPIAVNDSYNSIGNVGITVPDGASDLLSNDLDANNPGNTSALVFTKINNTNFSSGTGVATNNGTVTVNVNGSFSYMPNPGFEGVDNFTYTLSNNTGLTDASTVTITVSEAIWFVNAAAPAGGDGRLNSPFNCFVGTNCFDDSTADDSGDVIFLYSGNYNGGQALLADQKLIGLGATASIASIANINLTNYPYTNALPSTNGANPVITTSVSGTNAITLGTGNTLRGFSIGNVGNNGDAADIGGTGFGTLTINEVNLNGTGRPLSLINGTLAAIFTAIASTASSGGAGIGLTNINGSLTVNGATSITNAAGGQGISISGSPANANFGTSTTISDPATQGILVNTSSGNIQFGNTTVSDATDAISLQNNSAGTRTFGTIQTVNGSGVGFLHANAGGATVINGAATFTNPAGRCIDIQNAAGSGNAVSFSNVNATQCGGTGVFLSNNAGNTTFADLDISPDAGQRGFQATNNTGIITTTSGTIGNISNAPAVEITNASGTVPLNLQLTSVTANGGANGIKLQNTSTSGSPGGFRVLGTGAAGSGGTIQNATNNVSLTDAASVSLNYMIVTAAKDEGITGTRVTGFTLTQSSVTNNGDGAASGDEGIQFVDLWGTATMTNNTVTGNSHNNIMITNSSGTASLTITGGTVGQNRSSAPTAGCPSGCGASGLLIESQGTANFTSINVSGGTYTNNYSNGILINAGVNSQMGDVRVTGVNFSENNIAMQCGVFHAASMSCRVMNNTIINLTRRDPNGAAQNATSHQVVVGSSALASGGSFNARVSGNTIGSAATSGSGSSIGSGIRVIAQGNISNVITVDGNTVRQCPQGRGMEIHALGSQTTGLTVPFTDFTVVNNDVNQNDSTGFPLAAIYINADNQGSPARVRADIRNNTTPGGITWEFPADGTTPKQLFYLAYNGGIAYLVDTTAPISGTSDGELAATNPNAGSKDAHNDASSGSGPITLISGPIGNVMALSEPFENKPDNLEQDRTHFGKTSARSLFSQLNGENILYSGRKNQAYYPVKFIRQENVLEQKTSLLISDDLKDEINRTPGGKHRDSIMTLINDASNLLNEFSGKLASVISPVVSAQGFEKPGFEQSNVISGETINKTLGTIPSGEQIVVQFKVTVDSNIPANDFSISNQATISAAGISNVLTDGDAGTSGIQPTITGVTQPPSISKAFGGQFVSPNEITSLTFVIQNGNPLQSLSQLTFTDIFPAGLIVANPLPVINTCGGTLQDDAGGLLAAGDVGIKLINGTRAANGTCTISINVTGTTEGAKNNTTTAVSSLEGGTGLISNTATLTVINPPTLAKSFSPNQIQLGAGSTLQFTLSNPNTTLALSALAFTDSLPAGMAAPDASPTTVCTDGSYLISSNVISFTKPTLSAGANCQFSITVTGMTTGLKTNTTSTVTTSNSNEGTAASADLTVNSLSISGTVNYVIPPMNQSLGQQQKVVGGVLMSATGAGTVSETTDVNGFYELEIQSFGGQYTVTPSKTGDISGITAFDATLVLRHVAAGGQGANALSVNQQMAADTDGDSTITAFDATLILRFVAAMSLNPNTGYVGSWKFIPNQRPYGSVTSSLLGENYDAILVGEVDGDWMP